MQIVTSPARPAVLRRAAPIIVLVLLAVALAAPAAAVAAPSVLTIEVPLRVVPYNTAAVFHGTLTDELLNPIDGYTVQFQRSLDKATWITIADVPSQPGPYTYQYSATYVPARAYWFRFSFAGDAPTWDGDDSEAVLVKPRVSLSRPAAPNTVKARKAFTSYGYLKPRHAAGAVYVKIRCYRKSSSGAWVLKKIVNARDVNYQTWTKYTARVSLPTAGKWKLLARYAGTTKYATTLSNPRFVTAK
jgi:hypothetical protein